MFSFHTAVALELIAFGLGIGFLVWSFRNQGEGVKLAKIAGYIITILAVIGYLYTIYSGVKYWSGEFYKVYKMPIAYPTPTRHGDK